MIILDILENIVVVSPLMIIQNKNLLLVMHKDNN